MAVSSVKDFSTKKEHTQGQKTPTGVNGSQTIDKGTMNALKNAGKNQNDVTIKGTDGSSSKITGYVKDGVTYVPNSSGGGDRLVDGGDGKGNINKNDMKDIDGWRVSGNGDTVYRTEIYVQSPKKEKEYNNRVDREERYYEPEPYIPPPPPKPQAPSKPSLIVFNTPMPAFSSKLQKVNKFSYFFGLDKLKLQYKIINKDCCFVSEEIILGTFKEDEYIQLDVEHEANEYSSLEFYIIDGTKEIPILPINDKEVFNEKIFYNLRTRFPIDTEKAIEIKKDGIASGKTVDQAIQSNDGLYTITYSPEDVYSYKPLNSSVKIKIIQRLYDKAFNAPFVSKIKIRKHGGNSLWKDDISIL
jgi:hypothetical protein